MSKPIKSKNLIIIFLYFGLVVSFNFVAQAATNDFTANGDITVTGVTFGAGTADMLIMNGSTAESWNFDSGTFTVTNPGTFMVGSSDAAVKSIKFMQGSINLACSENSTPGTSYATAPTAAGTYTIVPSTTTDCTSLCAAVANAAIYNSFPTCGAASCNSGYTLSGSGANATCVSAGGGAIILKKIIPETSTSTPATEISPSTTAGEPAKDSAGNVTLEQMLADAEIIASSDVNKVIAHMGVARNIAQEADYNKSIVSKIIKGTGVSASVQNAIINFVAYSTPTTKILGAGERAGVVASFKSAFNRLPATQSDWNDVVKIANGRWPSQRSKLAEDRAKINFKIVYLRDADMSNTRDNAAITVMAYGLRPAKRNLNSEKVAIKSFKAIFGYSPVKATAWDVVRAIAYSGARR